MAMLVMPRMRSTKTNTSRTTKLRTSPLRKSPNPLKKRNLSPKN